MAEGKAVSIAMLRRRLIRFLGDLPPDLTVYDIATALGPLTPLDPVEEYAKDMPDDDESRRWFKP